MRTKKKGAPSGLFVIRIVFSSDTEEERSHFERLKQYCESKGINLSEYAKNTLIEHARNLNI